MTQLSVWASLCLVFLLTAAASVAQEQPKVEEFRDSVYGYTFRYPADWELQKLPEGDATKEMRVALRGAAGSSFTVVVAKGGKKLSQVEFESGPKRAELLDDMMRQTIKEIYRGITKNLGAEDMKMGERRDLSNSAGVKFYISTLNMMKAGKPVIVAGIHAFPYAKSYSINFMMTAFLDPKATKENELLTAVFNSFHLLGEPINPGAGSDPAERSTEKAEPK